MSQMNQTITINVPLQTAYNQWTQFESFPQFMSGVERVEQVSDTKTHWVAKIMGVTREFDAEIIEQHPDEWISWKTEGGLVHTGDVIFKEGADSTTLVAVQDSTVPAVGAVMVVGSQPVVGEMGDSASWTCQVAVTGPL